MADEGRGDDRGRCGSCGETADLRLTESGYPRDWRDMLKSDIDDRVDRRVTCSACRRTYPVRAADDSPLPGTVRSFQVAPVDVVQPVAWKRRASDR